MHPIELLFQKKYMASKMVGHATCYRHHKNKVFQTVLPIYLKIYIRGNRLVSAIDFKEKAAQIVAHIFAIDAVASLQKHYL